MRFIVGEVLAALLSIHEMGFAYFDLKPENVLITASGEMKC
jgi:serine/threonine protein kinase